jgi:general stress protein CsbA
VFHINFSDHALPEVNVTSSKQLAGLIGPTIVAIIVSEFPLVQPRLYEDQIPPVIYLSGVLLFVAGLAVVYAHNRWRRDWTVLVTLSGWFALVLGLIRMFAASAYQQGFSNTSPVTLVVFEGILLVAGLIMTFQAYRRENA